MPKKQRKKVRLTKKKFFDDTKLFLLGGVIVGILIVFGFLQNLTNMTGYVTSPTEQIQNMGKGVMNLLEPLAKTLLGDVGGDSSLLFAKVLFLIIIFGIFYLALNPINFFQGKPGISFLIVASASILSVRWLSDASWIQTILLPYSTVGIAVLAGLPFVMYFLIVNKGMGDQPGVLRRTAWIFFAIVFIGLWFSRFDEIIGGAINIYPITVVAAGLMAWWDGTIHKYFVKIKSGKAQFEVNKKLIRDLKLELEEVGKAFKSGAMEVGDYRENSKILKERIEELSNV